MTDTQYDVVIIGAGHNGLVCAAELSRSGRSVLVVEAAQRPGGAAMTREFSPGFSVSSGAHLLTMLAPDIVRDMNLQQHGLVYAAQDLATIILGANGQQRSLLAGKVDGVDAIDEAAYAEFHAQSLRFARVLARFFSRTLPHLVERDWSDTRSLLKLGWDVRTLGRDDMQELLRLGLINIYDVAREKFNDPLLQAAVSMDGVIGSHMGPRSPNTVYGYLYRRLGEHFGEQGAALVKGGMGALGLAMSAAAQAAGATVRCGERVQRIDLKACMACGVTLASGETIGARTVVSNADPKTTFGSLLGLHQVDAGVARRVHNFRARGVTAKLHLALSGLPKFPGLDSHQSGSRLLLADDMNAIERAFNHAKYGEFSQRPVMEVSIPTVFDDSLAPAGQHVLSAIVQYAPYDLRQGWEQGRAEFLELCLQRLEHHAPGLRDLVIASELLVPPDLEAEFGMHGGHWHHGEIALDQALFMRPMPGMTQYETPVPGLFLCGAGAHPGGGVLGLAGRNAAREVIARRPL